MLDLLRNFTLDKKYWLIFIFFSYYFVFIPSSSASNIQKNKLIKGQPNINLITFLVSPDESHIFSIHTSHSEKEESKILLISNINSGTLINKIKLPLVTEFSWYNPQLTFTPDGDKLYITDIDKLVYAFDIKKQELIMVKNKAKQDIGVEVASGIIARPDGKYIYVADGVRQLHGQALIHTIDPLTDTVIATAESKDTGWVRSVMVLNNDASYLYIFRRLRYYEHEISIFDTHTNSLKDYSIKINGYASDMAINPSNGNLYVSTKGEVNVIDPANGKVIDEIKIGDEIVAITMALNGRKLFLVDNYHGMKTMIWVLETNTKKYYSIPLSISTRSVIKTSANGKTVYVSHPSNNTITMIDANTGSVVRELQLIN